MRSNKVILLAVADEKVKSLLTTLLEMRDRLVVATPTLAAAREALATIGGVRSVVCSEDLPDGKGIDLLLELRDNELTASIKRMLLVPEEGASQAHAMAHAIGAVSLPESADYLASITALLE